MPPELAVVPTDSVLRDEASPTFEPLEPFRAHGLKFIWVKESIPYPVILIVADR